MDIKPSSTLGVELSTITIDGEGVSHKRVNTRANLFTVADATDENDYMASVSIFRHYTGEPTRVVVLDEEQDIRNVLQACVNALAHIETMRK